MGCSALVSDLSSAGLVYSTYASQQRTSNKQAAYALLPTSLTKKKTVAAAPSAKRPLKKLGRRAGKVASKGKWVASQGDLSQGSYKMPASIGPAKSASCAVVDR